LKDGFVVKRPEKWGGDIVYKTYEEVEKAFADKSLSSVDLKGAVIEYVDRLIQPVRKHFEDNAEAKQVLEQVQSYQVTR
jgi:tyrosyl-tRNA synthetase